MISDTDVTKLKKVFATKVEFSRLAHKVELLDAKVERLDDKVERLNDRVEVLDEKMNHVISTLDGIAGGLQDLRTENGAGAVHLARHDLQIAALSKGTGVKLPN